MVAVKFCCIKTRLEKMCSSRVIISCFGVIDWSVFPQFLRLHLVDFAVISYIEIEDLLPFFLDDSYQLKAYSI